MSATATKVSQRDALAVLRAILNVSAAYICEGHEDLREHASIGDERQCDGMCKFEMARKTREAKSDYEMDSTPTLCTHEHEELPPGCWSIFWEGGDAPEDWVFDHDGTLTDKVRELTGGRVFIEPINNCVLGVYPA